MKYLRFRIPVNRRKKNDFNGFYYCVHEWLGYDDKRLKILKNTQPYSVGLSVHKEFIKKERLSSEGVTSLISFSGEGKIPVASSYFDQVLISSNDNMDFSGYALCSEFINKGSRSDALVLFSNTSLACIEKEFVLKCFSIYESDAEIGILGISSSKTNHQTIVPISFSPHIQTFFFVISNEIFTQFIQSKKWSLWFNSKSKYNAILNYEIALSDFVLKQGLSIAVLECDGKVNKYHYSQEVSGIWNFDDMRAEVKCPASACFKK